MKILVACEESQAVTKELRRLGHEAYSCDIIECSGGHPEWHIQGDVLPLLNGSGERKEYFCTSDNKSHLLPSRWDMILAFPPCTFLTNTGNRWFDVQRYGKAAQIRWNERCKAIVFFLRFIYADCDKIIVENPIGCMSSYFRKPDQIIHPYYFAQSEGDENCERKATCLWTKGVEPLNYEIKYKPRVISYKNGKGTDSPWHVETMELPPDERAKARSKTFHGIAKAMAEQWAGDNRDLGVWIESPACDNICSVCGLSADTVKAISKCPNCGKDMRTDYIYPSVEIYEEETGKSPWRLMP